MEDNSKKNSANNDPLVTIVTPSFNQGKFIEATIKSVMHQDYSNIQHLVFDGGSKDKTLEILERYKNTLTYTSEKDDGQTHAINKGFQAANGEIIGWLNSDDIYEPGAVKTAIEYLKAHSEVMMIYGKGAHINENGEFMEWIPAETFNYKRLAEICFICQPTVFFRADIMKEIGLLDESLEYCMDYDFWIRLGKKLKIDYIPIHLANTRLYGDTKTLGSPLPVHAEIIKTVRKHYGVAPTRWISAYSHHVLNRYLTRKTRPRDILYVSLTIILVLLNSLRFNHTLRIPGIRIFVKSCINHIKAKIRN